MSHPKISIIVPIYNTFQFLERCLTSIKNQTFRDIEVILVIDGSPDDSELYCKEFIKNDARFILKTKANGGLFSARNYGLKFAKGDYIGFVDSDDYVSLNYCEILYNYALKNDTDVLNFGMVYIKKESKEIRFSIFPKNELITKIKFRTYLKESSLNKVLWFSWSNFYKREFLAKNNITFNENVLLGEDSIFNLLCFINSERIFSIREPLYYYVYNPLSLTQIKYKPNLLKKIEAQFNERIKIHKKNKYINTKDYLEDIARNYIEHSLFMLLANVKNADISMKAKILEFKKIRESSINKFAYSNYITSIASRLTLKMKIIGLLFKKKHYFLLCIINEIGE